MRNLPLALRQASNAFGQDSAWLPLVTIAMPDDTTYRIVPNTDDVTFAGETYYAFPVQIDWPSENNKGEIPYITLRVSNVTRVLQGHLEALNGGIASTVSIAIVNTGLLSEDYAELTLECEVLSSEATAQWVSFKCGPANPMRRRCPLYRYLARYCNWRPYSIECGKDVPCDRTYANCLSNDNVARFGGFPGLEAGGLRVV